MSDDKTPEVPPGLEDHLVIRDGKVVRRKWDRLGIPSPQELLETLEYPPEGRREEEDDEETP